MKQQSFADVKYAHQNKRTHLEIFLIEIDRAISLQNLLELIQSYFYGEPERAAYPLLSILRVHLHQDWIGYSNLGMAEALCDIPILRQLSQLGLQCIPDKTIIRKFRRLLEQRALAAALLAEVSGYLDKQSLLLLQGAIVVTTFIYAPRSTKKSYRQRDPEIHLTHKRNPYYFCVKAHIGVEADNVLVHAQVQNGEKSGMTADAGYSGIHKGLEYQGCAVMLEIA